MRKFLRIFLIKKYENMTLRIIMKSYVGNPEIGFPTKWI